MVIPRCNLYLPIMDQIERDTVDIMNNWDQLDWDENEIEKGLGNNFLKFKIKSKTVQLVKNITTPPKHGPQYPQSDLQFCYEISDSS